MARRLYSIQALWKTAARRKLPLTVVVLNNSGYGATRSSQPGLCRYAMCRAFDLPGIDFVNIAEGMAARPRASPGLPNSRPPSKRGRWRTRAQASSRSSSITVPLLYAQKNLITTPEIAVGRQHMTDHIGCGVRTTATPQPRPLFRLSHASQRQVPPLTLAICSPTPDRSIMSVTTCPGATALTLTPEEPLQRPPGTSEITAAFDAE